MTQIKRYNGEASSDQKNMIMKDDENDTQIKQKEKFVKLQKLQRSDPEKSEHVLSSLRSFFSKKKSSDDHDME